MLTGRCQCGDVRYRFDGDPIALYICHCRECRKQSASAFGMSLEVARAGFLLEAGQPRSWSRPTDSGGRSEAFFCPRCGTRLWHQPSPQSERITIKAGSLDTPPDARKAVHIWTTRKLDGIVVPEDAVQYPGEPD